MLGILGLGSHTTNYYIQEINRLYQLKNGGDSTMPFRMLNSNFNDINPFLPDQFNTLIPITKSYILALIEMEIDRVLVPNITLHQTIDQIELSVEIRNKLIHPVEVTANNLISYGIKELVLFGSAYTMNADYISRKLSSVGIQVIKPSKQDQQKIDLIRRHIYDNGKTELACRQINEITKKYCDFPVLLGCTELSIMHDEIPQSFDMVRFQIDEAINFYSA